MNDENGNENLPTISRKFTPTEEEFKRALKVLRAGLDNGLASYDRPMVHGIGLGALATGHGLASAVKHVGPKAYEEFIESVRSIVGDEVWARVEVTTQSSWVKLEGKETKERIYVAKSSVNLSRVESTLDPELVPGAAGPDRRGGQIRSWISANPEAVAYAVKLIAGG